MRTYEIQPISQFEFRLEDKWVIRINPSGIQFNHEEFPGLSSNDFAEKFCDILEKCYEITFTKKQMNNDETPK